MKKCVIQRGHMRCQPTTCMESAVLSPNSRSFYFQGFSQPAFSKTKNTQNSVKSDIDAIQHYVICKKICGNVVLQFQLTNPKRTHINGRFRPCFENQWPLQTFAPLNCLCHFNLLLHPDLISSFREVPPEFENFRHWCMLIWKFRDGLEICFGQLNQRFNFCFVAKTVCVIIW